jgi:hypothetical protein
MALTESDSVPINGCVCYLISRFWAERLPAVGALGNWYEEDGGPLAIWRHWCGQVEGEAMDAGHFFPEELPEQTAGRLQRFFAGI